jgi:hypothetical protein
MKAVVGNTAETNRTGFAPSRRSLNGSGKRGNTHRRPQSAGRLEG